MAAKILNPSCDGGRGSQRRSIRSTRAPLGPAPMSTDVDEDNLEVLAPAGTAPGVSATAPQQLQTELAYTKLQLEAAHEELQSTNEELQSTVEELETTNAALQGTNAELESMNQELENTNEELSTINDELRVRSDELNHVNAFLESVLSGLRGGVVVLGRDLRVQVWSERVFDLWGLHEEAVIGRHIQTLDIGLPVEQLKGVITSALGGEKRSAELTLDATNHCGRAVRLRVVAMPLASAKTDPHGVILVMEDVSDEVRASGVPGAS